MKTAASIILPLVLIVSGCATPNAGTPVVQGIKPDDPHARLQFQRQITERHICSNDDAFHLLIQFTQKSDPTQDYAQRVRWLKDRKMLSEGFNRPSDEAATRGVLAVAISRLLQIKGGVMMRALPLSERYATRELVYRGVYPAGSSPHQTYSGLEIIGILAKMEDFQSGDPANLRASELTQNREGQ